LEYQMEDRILQLPHMCCLHNGISKLKRNAFCAGFMEEVPLA
jgi:hypothetical protein